MSKGKNILTAMRQQLNLSDYRKKHWEGTFDEYLDIVAERPDAVEVRPERDCHQRPLFECLQAKTGVLLPRLVRTAWSTGSVRAPACLRLKFHAKFLIFDLVARSDTRPTEQPLYPSCLGESAQ